jgi:hypothetical protein
MQGSIVLSTSGVARTNSIRIGYETRARRVSFAYAKRATAAAADAAAASRARRRTAQECSGMGGSEKLLDESG